MVRSLPFLGASADGVVGVSTVRGQRFESKRKWVLVRREACEGSGGGANEIGRAPEAGRVDEMVHKKHKKSREGWMRWRVENYSRQPCTKSAQKVHKKVRAEGADR